MNKTIFEMFNKLSVHLAVRHLERRTAKCADNSLLHSSRMANYIYATALSIDPLILELMHGSEMQRKLMDRARHGYVIIRNGAWL